MILPARLHAFARRPPVLLLAALAACVYDAKDRCGPDQQFNPEGYCTCVAGKVARPEGCVSCAANEIAKGTKCECVAGFARQAGSGPCTAAAAGLGEACDLVGKACPEASFAHCEIVPGTTGYCTSAGCKTSADCAGGYACRAGAGNLRVCRRPPTGQGKACQEQADCAGQEASACGAPLLPLCLVRGCDPAASESCHDGWKCCDVAALVGAPLTVCLLGSKCPGM
jgi:hypothetical protein